MFSSYHCFSESPIKAATGRCVEPESGDCSPAEGTPLVFKMADSTCSSAHMAFTFDFEGILRHKCSGMMVCPEGTFFIMTII